MRENRTAVRAGLAIASAITFVVAPASAADAGEECVRTVSIVPQLSAGEGMGTLTFAVSSEGCAAAGEARYEVTGGTASAGTDFGLPAGQLRWIAGDSSIVTITATIFQDHERESDLEDFTVLLTEPSSSIRLGRSAAQGRLVDDDVVGPLWVLDDLWCHPLLPKEWCGCIPQLMPIEPDCISGQARIAAAQPAPVTFRWSTVDGTATAGVDYAAVIEQTQTIWAGATTAKLPFQLLDRPPGTPVRWFYVRISAVGAGEVADSLAVVTLDAS